MNKLKYSLSVLLLHIMLFINISDAYRVGVGRADCTGPPIEITFMGYANLAQQGSGIHLRQFSRTFIVEDDGNRVVFITADVAQIGHGLRRDVVAKLRARYGDLYTMDNVMLSSTHTHSVPGGYLQYLLYDLTSFGFVRETFDAYVDGIFNSVVKAHENLQTARIYISQTQVFDASINRSPTSYLENPAEERAQYDSNIDTTLTQLKFVNSAGVIFGAFNWFPVHPVTMNNTNTLVSSDNVGYSQLLLEKEFNPPGTLTGQGAFVGAFGASALGDISPNIEGPKCEFTGLYCDEHTSTCPSGAGSCIASGPGKDMFESNEIIGRRIYEGASRLMQILGEEITGQVRSIHQYLSMPDARVQYFNSTTGQISQVQGCFAAMGMSFAAGTTDGPGAFFFEQGDTSENILWNLIRDFIAEPLPEDITCHAPKPIFLMTGRAMFPYEWYPNIVPTQLFQIGNVLIPALPGEFTTMSGRRIRNLLSNVGQQALGRNVHVILSGLSNTYASYVTTPEEYQVQRYEGASTPYGPYTLTIHLVQLQRLAEALFNNQQVDAGPEPPNMDTQLISLQPGVIFDGTPAGRSFGAVIVQPLVSYLSGQQLYVRFQAGNPRNHLLHERSYFNIERQLADGNFQTVATDSDWETKFFWERTSTFLGTSEVEITWDIPADVLPGVYRITYFGHSRNIFGSVSAFQGVTRTFTVVN